MVGKLWAEGGGAVYKRRGEAHLWEGEERGRRDLLLCFPAPSAVGEKFYPGLGVGVGGRLIGAGGCSKEGCW